MRLDEINSWLDSAHYDLAAAKTLYSMGIEKDDRGSKLLALYHLQQSNEKMNKVAIKIFAFIFDAVMSFVKEPKVKYRTIYMLIKQIAEGEEKQIGHNPHRWFDSRANKFLVLYKTGMGGLMLNEFLNNSLDVVSMGTFDKVKSRSPIIKKMKSVSSQSIDEIKNSIEVYRTNLKITPPTNLNTPRPSDYDRIMNGLATYDLTINLLENAFGAQRIEWAIEYALNSERVRGIFKEIHYNGKEMDTIMKGMTESLVQFIQLIQFMQGFLGTTIMSSIFESFEGRTRYPTDEPIKDWILDYIPTFTDRVQEIYGCMENSTSVWVPILEYYSEK